MTTPLSDDVGPVTWSSYGAVAAAIEAMRRDGNFDVAMQFGVMTLVENYRSQPVLNQIMNDRGRALFLLVAMYLHARADDRGHRLTTSRLIAFCEAGAICSRGRARAMLATLRWAGYVTPATDADGIRTKTFHPTALMIDTVRARWRQQAEMISRLERSDARAGAVIEALAADPDFVLEIAGVLGEAFLGGMRVIDHVPALSQIADRNAGLVMLMLIYLSDREGRPVPSTASLARRLHVSRTHVRETIRAAETAGLIAIGPSGIPLVLPDLADNVARFFAALMVVFDTVGRAALATRPVRLAVEA